MCSPACYCLALSTARGLLREVLQHAGVHTATAVLSTTAKWHDSRWLGMAARRLGRPDDHAVLIAHLMRGGHVREMCDVTLALVKTDEGLLANGRAAAAMVHQGDTPLVTKVGSVLTYAQLCMTLACPIRYADPVYRILCFPHQECMLKQMRQHLAPEQAVAWLS